MYNTKEWKSFSYGWRTGVYPELMKNRYPNDKEWYQALSWSKNIVQTRKLLQQVQNKANKLTDSILVNKGAYLDLGQKNKITDIDSVLDGSLLLPVVNDQVSVYLRDDYNFYLISKNPYSTEKRIIPRDFVLEINDHRYYVYELSMDSWRDLNYGYNGNIEITKSFGNIIYIAVMYKF